MESPLLVPFSALLTAWSKRSDWPSLEEYTEFVEVQRLARAPECEAVCFRRAEPKRTRTKRDSELELGRLYDGRIALKHEVPCLDQSYHDLFNALVWAAFPRAKRALHARQFKALQSWVAPGDSRLPNRRTREQDALTVFDEGGSVLLSPSVVPARHEPTPLAAGSCFILFGHALMEHVAYGKHNVRSAAVVLEQPAPEPNPFVLFDRIDRELATRLADPDEFVSPGADQVVEIDPEGALWTRASNS